MTRDSLHVRMTHVSLALLTATAFFTPLSSTIAYLSLAGLLICTIADTALRGSWRTDLALLRSHPLVLATVALLTWVAISTLWSGAPVQAAWSQWGRYLCLLIVPIALVVLNRPGLTSSDWIKPWAAFGAAMVLTVILTYVARVWPFTIHWQVGIDQPSVFKHYIIQGVLSSLLVAGCITAAWCLHLGRTPDAVGLGPWSLIKAKRMGPAWRGNALCSQGFCDLGLASLGLLAISALAAYSVVFLLPGRTGLLALAVVLLMFATTFKASRLKLAVMSGLIICGLAIPLMSSAIREQVVGTFQTLQDPSGWNREDPGQIYETHGRQASTLLRSKYLAVSAQIIMDHPWVGVGARSYQAEFCQRAGELWCEHSRANSAQPHNQLVLFLVEQGVVGALIFLAWVAAPLVRPARGQPPPQRYLLRATVAVFALHSLLDSTLHLATEGLIYPLLIALLIARDHSPDSREA